MQSEHQFFTLFFWSNFLSISSVGLSFLNIEWAQERKKTAALIFGSNDLAKCSLCEFMNIFMAPLICMNYVGRWVADDERIYAQYFILIFCVCVCVSFSLGFGNRKHKYFFLFFGNLIDVDAPAISERVRAHLCDRPMKVFYGFQPKKPSSLLANLIIGFRYIARLLA